jgi:hypothetical protein
MKRLMLFSAVLAATLASTAHAEGNGLCKPLCATEKRECRSSAAAMSDDNAASFIAMGDRNPNARVSRELSGKDSEAQVKQGYESRRVREQRACDTQYLRCVQACAKEDAATPPGKAGQQQ